MSTVNVVRSGNLFLFPNSPCCCSSSSSSPRRASAQLSFGSRTTRYHLIKLAKPRRAALRTRAMAAVCAPPAQTKPQSFYELLGISETGSISEIKKAYKQLARKYHPDVSPSDLTEEYTKRFIEVQEAYETLSDPQTRAMYDMDLARGLQSNFSTTGRIRRYERREEEEEWRRRWEAQLDELRQRSMQKEDSSVSGSSDWGRGRRTRRKRNNIFDHGFN